ncbi:MAG: signal peptidase II [Clostridia bacterium]|nr:signal peptidase II [Clostridia bacterium]
MKGWNAKRIAASALPALGVLLADRLSKRWAAVCARTPRTVVSGFLGWRYAENTGAAFSALAGRGLLLCLMTALIIAVALVWLIRHPACGGWTRTGITLIIAGGMGNLYDRLSYGYVIDFIELLFVRFAIFNMADMAVVCGAACLMIGILKAEGERR